MKDQETLRLRHLAPLIAIAGLLIALVSQIPGVSDTPWASLI